MTNSNMHDWWDKTYNMNYQIIQLYMLHSYHEVQIQWIQMNEIMQLQVGSLLIEI